MKSQNKSNRSAGKTIAKQLIKNASEGRLGVKLGESKKPQVQNSRIDEIREHVNTAAQTLKHVEAALSDAQSQLKTKTDHLVLLEWARDHLAGLNAQQASAIKEVIIADLPAAG